MRNVGLKSHFQKLDEKEWETARKIDTFYEVYPYSLKEVDDYMTQVLLLINPTSVTTLSMSSLNLKLSEAKGLLQNFNYHLQNQVEVLIYVHLRLEVKCNYFNIQFKLNFNL